MTEWFPKKDQVVELPDGTRRWVLAGQPIPPELVDQVPAKERKAVHSAT
ncbi:hypothetical protein [Streptomyces chiangmaiensis]|uniref:Uncharacterized protein n=1 Tax=Streptomyces chiangmaiensis TaxID=766497 RepID=A0ABU7FRR8_9ACTN|nr:hypothetical protein [Streptomyces chiangmaiensis]MED7826802.1 hypothetical protein [Streptomyces chiangmaiensis]